MGPERLTRLGNSSVLRLPVNIENHALLSLHEGSLEITLTAPLRMLKRVGMWPKTNNPHWTIHREKYSVSSVFVYISTIFKLTDLFILYFFIQNIYTNKKLFKKKGYKVMYKGSNCDRKSQLSEKLTEPLNPRESAKKFLKISL